MKALVIVDFQRDFVFGSLAVPDAASIRPFIRALGGRHSYDIVAATKDWHPPNHCSFKEQGGPWPSHCVAGTDGTLLLDGIQAVTTIGWGDFIKGDDPEVEEYSGARARDFNGSALGDRLELKGVDRVDVVGLALDYCVKATAVDFAQQFDTRVIYAATRAVAPETGMAALVELSRAGVRVV